MISCYYSANDLPPKNWFRCYVSEQTYYRWRKEYGGMQVEQAKRLKTLEQENVRLKRLVAEKELDIQILKEALSFESKNY